ncbi:PIN2/TERF1-interacting telomerase inhibitor 1-like [Penaeus chinensis]|uniref:PIN2/TERF1-interacting telomerase inhibitor 1-like n=1 Tax=Penaeus chinensis TaxID=139456 RepID=UPI001FB6B2B0|nr:PIN2/TERF1-interacting telomerase inhibitor 1-like [Penaeus chinensis]
MSMLAEPRRKTQQCFINPRGDAWSKDENKFGQKLMEKFGWSKGKGLGREEQGMTDCIKVLTKDNKKGIGFKGSDDEWIKHYEGFESVLANLNSDNSQENSASNSAANSDNEKKDTSSLERRSKGSKARVHYHKFTRGKDVSRYNSDDIACIIGSKRSKQLADIEASQIKDEDEVGQQVKLNGVTTVKGGTVQEYFAEKMAKLKMAQALRQEDEDNNEERGECEIGAQNGTQGFGYCYEEQTPINGKVSESEREERVGFAFEYPENGDDCTGDQAEKKKKKKKKKDKVKEKEVGGEEESVSDTESSVSKTKKRMREVDEDLQVETQGEVDAIVKKKKKKKKKSNKEKEEEADDDIMAEKLTTENCHEEEVEKLHVDADNEKEKKTKDKKKKLNLDVMKAEELPTENNCKEEPDNMQAEIGVNSEKKKKNKKKKSKDKSTEELPTENSCERESENVDVQKPDEEQKNEEEINGVKDAGNETEKTKKKKKRKLDEIDGNNAESSVTEPESSEKKKKKKKKKGLCQEEIQEENCTEPSVEMPKVTPQDCSDVEEAKIGEETFQEEESAPKRKKGKKKKQKRHADKDENSPSDALSAEEKGHSSTAGEGKKEGAESEETNNSEDKSDGKKR